MNSTLLNFSVLDSFLTLDEAEAVGVAGVEGAEGREAPLWEADDEERVGEAFRDPGLERRPRDRKAASPCDAPSGRMNFSLSSRLVRPRAGKKTEGTVREGLRSVFFFFFFLQQGAAEAASRVRERVSASLAADFRVRARLFWVCVSGAGGVWV